eukprot:6738990-Prymnesium_polylepis.1
MSQARDAYTERCAAAACSSSAPVLKIVLDLALYRVVGARRLGGRVACIVERHEVDKVDPALQIAHVSRRDVRHVHMHAKAGTARAREQRAA